MVQSCSLRIRRFSWKRLAKDKPCHLLNSIRLDHSLSSIYILIRVSCFLLILSFHLIIRFVYNVNYIQPCNKWTFTQLKMYTKSTLISLGALVSLSKAVNHDVRTQGLACKITTLWHSPLGISIQYWPHPQSSQAQSMLQQAIQSHFTSPPTLTM